MKQMQRGAPVPVATSATTHSNSSHQARGKLSRWLRGPDTVMDIDVDFEAVEECKKRWELKWYKYLQNLPESSLEHIQGMGQAELRERSNFLEAEFDRIREEIPVLNTDTNDPQVLAGLLFVGQMLENCRRTDIVSNMTAAKADIDTSADSPVSEFRISIEQLKMVERAHMFAATCIEKIVTLKQAQALRTGNEISLDTEHADSMRADSPRGSNLSQNMASEGEEIASAVQMTPLGGPEGVPSDSGNLTGGVPAANLNTFRSDDIGLGRLFGREPSQTRHVPMSLSSPNSHMKNLTALLGIAFFGASITWSTIYSGTRGDLVLVSWSACLFIVGAVGAAAASMLVLPEEDIVAKYLAVRWTVRIISLLAMVHVLAGMFLVTLAILVLDPAQESPQARAGRPGVRGAGGYAITVSVLFVAVSGAVWRRYTTRTWFRR